MSTPGPEFVTCACKHCGENIEFARDHAGTLVNCPHCQSETVLFVASLPPPLPPAPASVAPRCLQGRVLDFKVQSNSGIISGDDGRRYFFTGTEWQNASLPVQGTRVDFEVRDGNAVSIYLGGVPTSHGSSDDNTPSEYRGCYRSADEKSVAGVCAGLAHKWGVKRGGVQIGFVLLGLFYLIGVLGYIICWLTFKELPTKGVKFSA